MVNLFWLTTLIPGFALMQIFWPRDARRGLLATVAWSYVLTVALLAPVVVFAFTVHLSARTVSICYFALVLFGLIAAVRYGGVRTIGRLVRTTHWFEVALVLLAVALTYPLGAAAESDAMAHSAKIRYIRDVGFSLQDAYSPLAVIETKWHVNVHHLYFVVASWISGAEPLELFFRGAWFFRLLALSAIGFFAATVFRSRWIGAVAMLGAVAVMCTKLTIVFPFSVTGFIIVPVLLAVVVDVLERPTLRNYARAVLGSISLAVLHVGTWFLAALCIGPVVAIWALWRWPLRQAWRPLALAAAVLITGIPLLLVSALQPNYVVEHQDALHVRFIRTIHLGNWSITTIDPTHYAWMLPVLASLLLLAIISATLRKRIVLLAGIMIAGMAFMFTPGLYDGVVRLVPYWLLVRLRNFGEVIGLAVIAGGLAWMARPILTTRLARQAMALVVLCGSLAVFRENIQGYVQESGSQRQWLRDAFAFQAAVAPAIEPHSLVAADPVWSLVLPSVHLTRVMAADLHHANPSDGGLLERFADTQELLAPGTTDDHRRAIIAKHGIDYIVVRDAENGQSPPRFDAVGEVVSERGGFVVYRTRE
jgi:hypothetical protein